MLVNFPPKFNNFVPFIYRLYVHPFNIKSEIGYRRCMCKSSFNTTRPHNFGLLFDLLSCVFVECV